MKLNLSEVSIVTSRLFPGSFHSHEVEHSIKVPVSSGL